MLSVTGIKIDGVYVKDMPELMRVELIQQAKAKLTKEEVAALEQYLLTTMANETERQEHLSKIAEAMRKIKAVRPYADDDAFNEYAVLQLEQGEEVCGVRL